MMYEQLEAKLHDAFWEEEGAPAELPLIEHFLGQYPGAALELGCGSGRLLLPLLEKGFLIEGLDVSSEMLAMCRERAKSSQPVLHEAGMEDFNTGTLFSAILIPAFTLQLISPDRLPATLNNIQRHLQPGGGLYLTTFIPWAEITGELTEEEWFLDQEMKLPEGGAARCHTRFHIERISQKLSREHRYEILDANGNIMETSTSFQRLCWYWPREMRSLLADLGFTVQQVIGDFAPEGGCDEDSQVITYIARWDPAVTAKEAT